MGSGYRVFTAGEVLTASNVQNYLQDQAVMVFAGTAARSSAIGTANFEEGMLTYLTDVDKLQVYNGSSFLDVYPAASSEQLAIFNETQSSGTEGGANTAASYTKRTLNTSIVNTITGCSIASSVITLPAGTYHVTASAPVLAVNGHRIRFRNTTDSTTAVLGATGYTATSAPNNDRAILEGHFVITGSKDFELQHMTATLKSGNGLGAAQSQDALGEVYSIVTIRKIA